MRLRLVRIALALTLSACSEQRGAPAPASSPASSPEASAAIAAPPAAPPSVAAPAAAPAPVAPRAHGIWIWEFEKNAPTPERAAALAEELGAKRVFIKASNGNAGPRWAHNARLEALAPFARRGIEVWVFGYFYGEGVADADGRTWGTLDEQIATILPIATRPEVHGLIVDAEIEFSDRPADAERLCRSLRSGLAGKKLGYTSFGWIRRAPRFPFRAFDRHCGDVFLPQVYYAFGWPDGPEGSLARLEREAKALGLTAPMWPVQSNEPNPAVPDLATFFARAGADASVFYLHPEGSEQNARLREVFRQAQKVNQID